MERIGLVGLANSGKSSLFNALTGGSTPVAAHPFTTTESAVGVAHVPDVRLARLAVMSESKKVVEAGVEVVDIAGLVAGGQSGDGLGNRMLAGIREVDALCLVVRSFIEDQAPGETDPVDALSALELELVMTDLDSVENQLARAKKSSRLNQAPPVPEPILSAAAEELSSGAPIYRSKLGAEAKAALVPLFLLTNKPAFVVVNVGEDEIGDEAAASAVSAAFGPQGLVLSVSVRLEAEAALLDASDRAELLGGLGLGEGALARVARALFDSIGRSTFFTTGDKESRAWTYRTGAKAPECAGVIHSDLQRGFIRAEVIHWDELLSLGGWSEAKAAGKLRLEGKDYVVEDGDVLEIRFNV